jgi:hypothetical protein
VSDSKIPAPASVTCSRQQPVAEEVSTYRKPQLFVIGSAVKLLQGVGEGGHDFRKRRRIEPVR